MDFYNRFVTPWVEANSIQFKLTQPLATLENWVHAETARKLESFSRLANMGTGRGHPCDEERWLDFLLEAHKRQEKISTEQLRRWLIEEEGWPDDTAWDLCGDYEYGREVLKYYDSHR